MNTIVENTYIIIEEESEEELYIILVLILFWIAEMKLDIVTPLKVATESVKDLYINCMGIFDCIKGILFLLLGIALVFVPYSKFKDLFPAAPPSAVVKIIGVVIMLCGVIILAVSFMGSR